MKAFHTKNIFTILNNNQSARRIFLFHSVVVTISVVISFVSWSDWRRTFLVGLGISIVLSIFLLQKPVQAFLKTLPLAHKSILSSFLALFLVGQLIDKPDTTFPFISWGMYSIPTQNKEIIYYRYQGLEPSGKEVTVLPVQLFPTLTHGRFVVNFVAIMESVYAAEHKDEEKPIDDSQPVSRLRQFARSLKGPRPKESELTVTEKEKLITETLFALGRRYNYIHSESPISSLKVLRCSMKFRETSSTNTTCEEMWRVACKGNA